MSIAQEVQKLDADALVSLYILDTTPIGGSEIFRFTTMPGDGNDDGVLYFDGQPYEAVDIEATGFNWDGKGAFPKPKVRVANIGGLVTSIIHTYGDLVGSKFIRIRTFARHLDGGEDPDPTATFPPEIYTVDHRVSQNKIYVEWQLASSLEQMGVKLPRRQCIRDTCTHTYRTWDEATQSFNYENVSCPYVGNKSFNEKGEEAPASSDSCGRTLDDCKLRFGERAVLPTRAFPGIARNRVS